MWLLCTLSLPTSIYAFTYPKCNHMCNARLNTNKIRQSKVRNRFPITLQAQMAASIESDDDPPKSQSASTTSSSTAAPFVGLPSYRRIIFFVATTFLIWVSEPLLSLVDSAAVGRYAGEISTSAAGSSPNLSSVIQLASLGPATMLCDSGIYLTLFIAMATTNKLARAFAKHDLKEQITYKNNNMQNE